MKLQLTIPFCLALSFVECLAHAQGNFVNLGFESANPAGYSPVSDIPTTNGLPAWTVVYSSPGLGSKTASTVWYDGYSYGSAAVSINDTNTPAVVGFTPIQGSYSTYLFGGPSFYFGLELKPTYTTLSQTGVIPNGALSLLMDVYARRGFEVALGGIILNMVAVQDFTSYTRYGADISAYAGQTLQLSITAPPTASPNVILLDNIVFSNQSVPEPGTCAIWICGLVTGSLIWRGRTRRGCPNL